jgi:hypothetical protein
MNRKTWIGMVIGLLVFGISTMANAALVGQWNFNETSGTTAYASVGSVNGTLVGGVSFVTGGIQGGAVNITTGYVNMGNNFPSSSAFSIEAWVKIPIGDTSALIPVAKHWATIPQGYLLGINNFGDGYSQTGEEGFYSANGAYKTAVGGPAIDDGNWHQLVGVYDNGTTYIYVDGTLGGTGSAGYANNSADFMIGGIFNSGGSPVNYFQGLVSDVQVYDNALSGSDVKALYGSAVPVPPAILLFGPGLVGLAAVRRRFKK